MRSEHPGVTPYPPGAGTFCGRSGSPNGPLCVPSGTWATPSPDGLRCASRGDQSPHVPPCPPGELGGKGSFHLLGPKAGKVSVKPFQRVGRSPRARRDAKRPVRAGGAEGGTRAAHQKHPSGMFLRAVEHKPGKIPKKTGGISTIYLKSPLTSPNPF